jgi:hypothetical protein
MYKCAILVFSVLLIPRLYAIKPGVGKDFLGEVWDYDHKAHRDEGTGFQS